MQFERLPSGHYRYRKTINGFRMSFTFDEKPTKRELEERIMKETYEFHDAEHRTFGECARLYINSKDASLSPTTFYTYDKMMNVIDKRFMQISLCDIKQINVQQLLNNYAKTHKPKSVKNLYSFVNSVMKMFIPNTIFRVTLPKPKKDERLIPTDEDVKKLFKIIKGTEMEIVISLACFSLRRGEIAALTMDDIGDGVINVNKSVALIGSEQIVKSPKTYESTRKVFVPKELTDKIRKQGYVWKLNPMRIQKRLSQIQKENGLPHFNLHLYRHYMASASAMLGIPQIITQNQGGWSNNETLAKIYTHQITDKFDNVLSKHFNDLIGT